MSDDTYWKDVRAAAQGVLARVHQGKSPNPDHARKAAEGVLVALKDLEDAAGELLVDVPHPGTVTAKLLSANKIMREERNKLLQERNLLWFHARDRVDWYDGDEEVAELAERMP